MSRAAWIALVVTAGALTVGVVSGAFLAAGSRKTDDSGSKPVTRPEAFSLPLTASPSVFTLAKHEGDLLVGLAARRGGPVEVVALRAETPVPSSALHIRLGGLEVDPKPCGTGCFRIEGAVLEGSPTRLSVRSGQSRVSFDLPERLPPNGERLVGRALTTMVGLRSFRFSEHLSSGRNAVVTEFEVQAPNRVRFRTASGFRSVIIGRNRWDYQDGRWQRSPFPGLTVAQMLIWHGAKHARVVGHRGGATELTAFGLLPVRAWFRLTVAPSGRVTEAEMIAPSHFMAHRYSDYNKGLSIKPPVPR